MFGREFMIRTNNRPLKETPDVLNSVSVNITNDIKSQSQAEIISDCQVLLAGGMGWGAYESMQSYNIKPIVTDVKNIDEAVQLYLDGKLTNLMERLH